MKDTIKLVVFHNSWKLPKIVWPQVIRTVLINFRYVFLKCQSIISNPNVSRTKEVDSWGQVKEGFRVLLAGADSILILLNVRKQAVGIQALKLLKLLPFSFSTKSWSLL